MCFFCLTVIGRALQGAQAYYGPEHKSIFVIKITGEYKYVSCSHHPLWKYWILTIYYAVLEWVLRKQGEWHDSAEENMD